MPIIHLRTNQLKNPLGLQLGTTPHISWITDAKGERHKSARVEVSLSDNFEMALFDSGVDTHIDSLCYALPITLRPRTRYFWRVTVKTDLNETITSDIAWFETAKMSEPWKAQWITPGFSKDWHPELFTAFTLKKKPLSARAYVCGLGLYELHLNAKKQGDQMLTPGLCAYDKWLPYQTLDVTSGLRTGKNELSILLGNGWYKGRYGLNRKQHFQYGDRFAAICELIITYDDGTCETIITDMHWQARRQTVLDSNIFDGETRDDTLDCSTLYSVKPIAIGMERLEPMRSPSMKVMQIIKPVKIIKTPAGETVLDMGQNMVGVLEFRCRAPRGTQIHLQFGEVLQDGNFYRDNLRTALCEYRYTSDGTAKWIRPRFTFYGFRYVKLTDWHEADVKAADFRGLVIYSDLEATGTLTTSNKQVNRLIENALWGQRGNFLDVPTDCPQRDERMGWTGDAQVFFGTAAFNMNVWAFFSKFCYDLMREQQALDGSVPVVIPKHDVQQTGACAWGDAATIIPWSLYVNYGDKTILSQQYESMKAWVDYIRRCDIAHGGEHLWKGGFHYGDWLALDTEDPIGDRFGGTDRTYLASAFYRYSALLVSKAARVLGNEKDAESYLALSQRVKQAIIREYVTKTGRLAINTQTAYVLALHFDLLPDEFREQAAHSLSLKLKQANFHLRTGFIGTPYLCRTLSENGYNEISYRLLLQDDFPSWLYQVNMGATTIWERWNSILPDGSISDTGMNSLNHYSYGSIVEWIYRNCAGIKPMEQHPGYREFELAPQPNHMLHELKARFLSPFGEIVSEWKIEKDGEVTLRFVVPFGAKAHLTLPCSDQPKQLLAPGEYVFHCRADAQTAPKLDMDTPISAILANKKASKALKAALPGTTSMMLFDMLAGEKSLRDLSREGFFKLTQEAEADLVRAMGEGI